MKNLVRFSKKAAVKDNTPYFALKQKVENLRLTSLIT